MGKLTATEVKQASAQTKPYKLVDGAGLYLLISPSGSKYWRYDYRFAGKRKTLALGVYPGVTLKDARESHLEVRSKLSKGIDPADVRKVEKHTRGLATADSFEAISREWFEAKMGTRSENHRSRTLRALEKDLFPPLGNRPIANITPPELLAALRKIEGRGAIETAHRAKQTASQIFRYAVASGRAERDIGADLRGALKETKEKHLSSITDPKEVGKLLVAIDGFRGSHVVHAALRISPLLFQRPGEIRQMEW